MQKLETRETESESERELTEILNGGVDGVATVKKETDEPGSYAATAAGDANHFTLSRHLFTGRGCAQFRESSWFPILATWQVIASAVEVTTKVVYLVRISLCCFKKDSNPFSFFLECPLNST